MSRVLENVLLDSIISSVWDTIGNNFCVDCDCARKCTLDGDFYNPQCARSSYAEEVDLKAAELVASVARFI